MPFGRRMAHLVVVSSLAAGGLVAAAPPVLADFHLMKVQGVYAGSMTDASSDYVELNMTAAGQNVVGGHTLHLYDPSGGRMDCAVPSNVPNANNGDPILFLTTQAQAQFLNTADFTIAPLLDESGGAVCWESIDCVSWGSFSGATTSPAGTPFAGGIPPGSAIERSTDTNNSATDFAPDASPTPNSNGPTNLGSASCQPFTGGGGAGGGSTLKNLRAKVRGNKAIISGQVLPPAPGDTVALTFFANGSPLHKVAKKNAVLNADSKFKKRFRIPDESTRCKVKVAFHGATLGQKKFRC
jgi:hypothetical protein